MGYWIFMLVMVLLMPLTMLLTGRAFSKNAPKTINSVYGYRTPMSMKNQDTWQFAHRYFGRLWYRCGLVLTPVTAAVMCLGLKKGKDTVSWLGSALCIVQLAVIVGSIAPTERALRRTFHKDGSRKET